MHLTQDASDQSAALKLQVEQLHIQNEQGEVLVENLNFHLYAGQTLAIVGESGSGKSISSLALLGLLPANLKVQGKAILASQNLLNLSETAKRQIRGHKNCYDFSRTHDCT